MIQRNTVGLCTVALLMVTGAAQCISDPQLLCARLRKRAQSSAGERGNVHCAVDNRLSSSFAASSRRSVLPLKRGQ